MTTAVGLDIAGVGGRLEGWVGAERITGTRLDPFALPRPIFVQVKGGRTYIDPITSANYFIPAPGLGQFNTGK